MAQFLVEKFGSASAGLNACADIMYQIARTGTEPDCAVQTIQNCNQARRASIAELRGIFTADEWKYFADLLNGTNITAEFRCHQSGLIAVVEDGEVFDSLGTKWSVDIDSFCKKIKQLSGAQIDAVYSRVETYWNNHNNAPLEEWAKW